MFMKKKAFVVITICYAAMVFYGCDTGNGEITKSSDALLKSLSVKDGDVELIDNFDAQITAYSVTVPYATASVSIYAEAVHEKASLVYLPEFDGDIGGEGGVLILDVGANTTVEITVTAENENIQKYTLKIYRAASDEKTITAFAIGGNQGVIVGETIVVTVPYGTDVTKLSPVIQFSGKSISPASGTEQDFSNPVTYTCTADDGSERSYTVLVKHTASDTKEIYAFVIGNNIGVISGTNITVTVPYGTDVTKLSPIILFSGKSISPASGVEQDFSGPVTYTVTADDGSEKNYTVMVVPQGKPAITIEFSGIADEQIDLTTDTQQDISRKNNDTLEIRVNAALLVLWFIDGTQQAATGASITINAVDYPVGIHYVTALVYRGGIPYSNELAFRVVE
jgi:hypothetical protein